MCPCTQSGAWSGATPRPRHSAWSGSGARRVLLLIRSDANAARRDVLPVQDDAVDQSVVRRLLRAHEVVALHVRVDPFDRLPGVVGEDLLHAPLEGKDLAGPDLDVGGLPFEARRA